MPKETFYNLIDEKREKIEQVAMDEFADNGFLGGSINRIIDNAGIAKGSFYQYFDNKEDLYLHISSLIVAYKMVFINEEMKKYAHGDFFSILRGMYMAGLRFAKAHPRALKIGNDMLKHKDLPIYERLMDQSKGKSVDIFEQFIGQGIESGVLRDDLDIAFISHMMTALNIATIEYYARITLNDNEAEWSDDMLAYSDMCIDFIRNGIGK